MEWWSCFGQPFHHSGSRPAQKTCNIHLVPALMLTLSTKQARKDNQYPLIATIRILTSFSLRCAALKKRKEHLAVPFPVIYFLLLSFSFFLFQYVFYAHRNIYTKALYPLAQPVYPGNVHRCLYVFHSLLAPNCFIGETAVSPKSNSLH